MFQPELAEVAAAVAAAAGRRPGTVLLKRAALLNVHSGERYETDILLAGRLVAALGPGYRAEMEIDLEVWDLKHLNRIISGLREQSAVGKVTRTHGER